MLTLYDFIEARERLQTVTVKTKLIHSTVFSDESGNDVYIKPENLQRTGSFKLRGAYNKIAKLTKDEKRVALLLPPPAITHKAWRSGLNDWGLKQLS